MMLTTHVMVGATLALTIAPDRPWLAFLLGFVSHLLIDVIPHGDADMRVRYQNGQQVKLALAYNAIDAVVAIVVIGILLNLPLGEMSRGIATLGIFGGVLPDLLAGLREILKSRWLEAFHRVHFFFHDGVTKRWGDIPLWVGIGVQVIVIAALFPVFR